MAYLDSPEVTRNGDGSYTIAGGPGDPRTEDGGDWTLLDTGDGWEATHEFDGFPFGMRWATAEDAAHAVLGDPATARKWGQR